MTILALSPITEVLVSVIGYLLIIVVIVFMIGGLLAIAGITVEVFTPESVRRKREADEERKRISRILDSLSDENGNISIGIKVIHEKEASSTSRSTLPDDVSHSRYSSASQTGPAAPQPSSSWPPA